MTKIIDLSVKEKIYKSKKAQISILNDFRLEVAAGEKIAIVGESGAGKSSLLNIIGLLDRNYAGEYTLFGSPTDQLHTSQLAQWRNQRIGFVLQESALINSLTVEDNIKLPFLYASPDKKGVGEIEDFDTIISAIGIRYILKKKPLECSGGEKARAVFARGIIMKPQLILADEPTGNLDVKSAKSVMKLLKDISKNKLVVIVTHNYEQVEEYATRRISMNDGKIIEDKKISAYEPAKAELVQYRDLTKKNKLILGLRNAFNIKTKFGLLFLVYFFLTMLVFSEYSSLNKASFDAELEGDNYYFSEKSPNRVILKKKNKYYIYILVDDNNVVQYVGQTTNINKRQYQHSLSANRGHLNFRKVDGMEFDNRLQARFAEQAGIEYFNTLNKVKISSDSIKNPLLRQNNQRNEISPKGLLYPIYEKTAKQSLTAAFRIFSAVKGYKQRKNKGE